MEKRQSVRASGNLLKTKQNEITEQKQVNKKKKKKGNKRKQIHQHDPSRTYLSDEIST